MKMNARTRDFYVRNIAEEGMAEFGLSDFEAVREFISSQTYAMLIDEQLQMNEFSPLAIFDMWKAEREQGDPRLSVYIAGE